MVFSSKMVSSFFMASRAWAFPATFPSSRVGSLLTGGYFGTGSIRFADALPLVHAQPMVSAEVNKNFGGNWSILINIY